jgi:hypothetical protein
VAFTFLGLTVGDDGTGFQMPSLAEWRGALATKIRQLRGIANLNTEPGSFYGDIVDLASAAVDLAGQAASEAVSRTVYTAMGGVSLEQFLADIVTRVVATASTATVYVYGTAGAVVPISTAVRTSAVGTAFVFLGAAAVPAAPTTAYAIEIKDFAVGAQTGQAFTATIAGTPVAYVAGGADDGEAVRDGLIAAINANVGLTQEAYRGGQSPTTSRFALILVDTGGAYAVSVAGPALHIFAWPAVAGSTTAAPTLGPTSAPAESLRVGPPFASLQGYVNIDDAILGRSRENDSQLKARHQLAQRGLGGGSPDAIKAIILSPIAVNGGGATYCAVEYNPGDDDPDTAGNKPHSVRVVVDADADGQAVANALWRAKAAGDNTNGPESFVVVDSELGEHDVLIDRLDDVWFGVIITVTIGTDWPAVGDPLAQLREDVAAYIEGLQPAGNNAGGVRVNLLPISTFPNGETRGVINFTVQVGSGPQGGPYVYQDIYPTIEPDADAASIILTSRDKPRCSVVDVAATIV